MEVSRELLFFFSALGAFNGLLMSFYFLFFARPKHTSNYFLGAFLLSMSVRIGKSVFFYFNSQLSVTYLQIGLTGCLLIGPFLFFYLKSILKPESNINRNWWHHGVILFPMMAVIFTMYSEGEDFSLWRRRIVLGIYCTWLAYSILAGFTARELLHKIFTPKAKLTNIEIWMASIFIGNTFIWGAYFFAGFMSYILGALLFSFFLYLLILLLFFAKKKDSIIFQNGKKNSPIPNAEADRLMLQLKELMTAKELYKNPNLKLADMASELQVLPHTISKILNEHHGYNFSHFLNEYRIEQAKELILSNQDYTFEGIGYDSGFNSKSTFFATFKKFTGTTPAKFKKSVAN
ncbi:MAG: AraC-like DNA-binding protein [Saprospiraceae bacterium]|jgi:AraC-like DNA-binding protein